MSTYDVRRNVIDIINSVRNLVGYNDITDLRTDKYSVLALRMLNFVIAEISNYGDWQELYATKQVAAVSGQADYSIGVKHPVKNIFEISYDGDSQALYPLDIDTFNRLSRGLTTGRPRHFAIKRVDEQGNPKFSVTPTPGTDATGKYFEVAYYKKPMLYGSDSADTEIIFPANLVIQGLYSKVLEEEAGGTVTKESIAASRDYYTLMQEELNRYNADSGAGAGISFAPTMR